MKHRVGKVLVFLCLAIVFFIGYLVEWEWKIEQPNSKDTNKSQSEMEFNGTRKSTIKTRGREIKKNSYISAKKDNDIEYELVESSSAIIYGVALDEDNQAISDVHIQLSQIDDRNLRWQSAMMNDCIWESTGLETDETGCFQVPVRVRDLPISRLKFSHRNYQDAVFPIIKSVQDKYNRYSTGKIYLKQNYFICGQVKDINGKCVSESIVTAKHFPYSEVDKDYSCRVRTDKNGRFQLCIGSQEEVRVFAYKENIGSGWSPLIRPGIGRKKPEITVTVGGDESIEGELLDEEGTPIVGKRLFATGKIRNLDIKRTAITDEQGKFKFHTLKSGSYKIEADQVRINQTKVGKMGKWGSVVLEDSVISGEKNLTLFLSKGSMLIMHLEDCKGNPLNSEPKLGLYYNSSMDSLYCCHVEHVGTGTFSSRLETPLAIG